jgi:hypothetical protein
MLRAGADPKFPQCYMFALKTFYEGSFNHYYDEKKAFDGLKSNRGVIRRLGCYSHPSLANIAGEGPQDAKDPRTERKPTMNLLLEWGQYDLGMIFAAHSPPVFPKEICTFWEALFEVADAVSGIHEFKTGGNEFNG